MRRRLLRLLVIGAFRAGWAIGPLSLALTVVAVWAIAHGDLDTGLQDFLPGARSNPPSGLIRRLEPVICRITSEEPGCERELIELGTQLAELLNDRRYFQPPVYRADPVARTYYESLSDQRLMALLSPEDLQELQHIMSGRISAGRLRMLRAWRLSGFLPRRVLEAPLSDPLGALAPLRQRLAASSGPARLEVRDGYFLSADGQAMTILLYPTGTSDNVRATLHSTRFLEQSRKYALKHWEGAGEFDIEFIGRQVDAAHVLRRMGVEAWLITLVAAPLSLLVILLVFRKFEACLFIVLPPALGFAWAGGLTAWLLPSVSFVSLALLIVIFAMGMISSVHLYHRLTLELYRERSYYRALRRSYLETGRGVVGSAVVRTLLFVFLLGASLGGAAQWPLHWDGLDKISGATQAALVAVAGVAIMLMANLVTIPVLAWVKHRLARGRVSPVEMYNFPLKRFYEPAIFTPRTTVAVMVLVSVVFGFQASRLDFSPRFASDSTFFFSSGQQARDDGDAPLHGRPLVVIVSGSTLEGALRANDEIYGRLAALGDRHNLLSFDSLRPVLPSRRTQEAAYERLAGMDFAPLRQSLDQAAQKAGLVAEVYRPFLDSLDRLKRMAADPQYIELALDAGDSFVATVQRFVERDEQGRFHIVTLAYPSAAGFGRGDLDELEKELSRGMIGSVAFAGDPVVERRLESMVNYNMALMILLSIAAIFISFVIHFRSLRFALLTFVPVALETLWLCGAMAMTGVSIHFFTVLMMPLALSLAMDNALQIVQYYKDRRPVTVRRTMERMGRGAALTCCLSSLMPGAAVLAHHGGLRDCGAFILLAALVVMGGCAMLQPALIRLFGSGRGIFSALLNEE